MRNSIKRLFGSFGILFLAAFEAGVVARELVVELFDTSSSINVLQTSGVERVASRANIDFHFGLSAAGYERVSATASYLHFDVTGVNSFFHLRYVLGFFRECGQERFAGNSAERTDSFRSSS